MLRFADGTAIEALEEINLKRALERLEDILERNYKMKINRITAEFMACSKNRENINIIMDDDVLKQVPKFKCPGSLFKEDGENKEDIIQRGKEYKIIFNNRKQLYRV